MKIGPIEIRRRRRFSQEARAPLGSLTFTCNVCGSLQSAEAGRFDRESVTCEECRSNVRFRAIVHLLTEHFLGHSAVLSHVSPMKHIKGLGLSDWPGYAELLAEKFDYVNTHFDRPPPPGHYKASKVPLRAI